MTERKRPPDGQESLFGVEVRVEGAPDELAALERATAAGVPQRTSLAGPTLDDVVSHVWEGLLAGVPAACPVCHGEVVPLAGAPLVGRCTSCGTEID